MRHLHLPFLGLLSVFAICSITSLFDRGDSRYKTPFPFQHQGFEIEGSIEGFPDGYWLHLEFPDGRKDSTLVNKNRFSFKGNLQEKAVNVVLHTRDYSDYKFFWLENEKITFKAQKGKFRQATIEGSKTQIEQEKLTAAIEKSGNEKETSIAFVKSNPSSIVSVYVLSVYTSTWGKDITTDLYKNLSDENKETFYGKSILEFISLNKNIKVGDMYIDFEQPDPEGNIIRLSDFKGKVVLLEFWGSWCGPCRKGHPELLRTYNEFKPLGFDILGVAAEKSKQDLITAIQKDGLSWKNVSDFKGDKNKAALIYGVSYYPANFLIDKNGTIVAKDLRGNALRNKLREILK